MSIKSILCAYGGAPTEQRALDIAPALGGAISSRAEPPDVYPDFYGITLCKQARGDEAIIIEAITATNADRKKTHKRL